MSKPSPVLKKPKVEQQNNDGDNEVSPNQRPKESNGREEEEEEDEDSIEEQKVALIALIEHRSRELQHLKQRISYYQTQLVEAEKMLEESQVKLGRLGGKGTATAPNKPSVENGIKNVKGRKSPSPVRANEASPRSQPQSGTELVVPKVPQPLKLVRPGARMSCSSARPSSSTLSNGVANAEVEKPSSVADVKVEKSYSDMNVKMERSHSSSSSDVEVVEIQDRGTKRKIEQKELKELVHTANDQLFVSSALDGMVHLWQLQAQGSGASILSTTDCMSPLQHRWPEDIAWHPLGNSLFSAYTADSGDSQISILNLNKTQGRARVTFLDDKPHIKGTINSIEFMPWENTCFVTGCNDHGVVLWNEKDDESSWKPETLHRNLHSSAVMGVAGMQQKQIVLSAGADKRIVGFDVQVGRADFKHQLDSKCMSVLPNPCDFNLFMVQTGTHGKQLRLFDIRQQMEIHSLGFKQESSDSQSALTNQAWSPDGLYLTSGSVDPVIHIFDIRYNYNKPSQSIKAHQKRVFKAVWHYSLPLLISISSDLHIGLHKII
ncbi:TRANSDUCIN FAMILY PROTEIN / WD-40 REPEAT FAMILY PROTEIN [Salix viminalis]|uniref:TRANSDUCIN FAMILY PROTEIN / WD-40 REPEAT FAMILY PROTEIN n=1 Tax=Salix viminalis TaxID=40686 RepID=A0A9Q0SGP0_SALVM|nr:TRANSDUCIN FAMILY PROTEIN / WD-40 REPEAT FAMILY PROTEIN [Salix viminalis]